MTIMSSITGFLFFLVMVVGVILSLTGKHRSKFLFAIAFADLAGVALARQVMYMVMGPLLGGAYYGSVPWIVATIMLSLMEIAGFVVLIIGARSALSTPSAPVAGAGMPVPYGVPAGQPPGMAPAPGGPVCPSCGLPAMPGQPRCARCGTAL